MELTEEQLKELKQTLSGIGSHLPESKAGYIWSTFNHIRNERENQPCTCGSAGAHWKRAVDFLNDYIKNK